MAILHWNDRDAWYGFLSADNYPLLMVDTEKITDNFTFLYFKEKFITWSFCTPEDTFFLHWFITSCQSPWNWHHSAVNNNIIPAICLVSGMFRTDIVMEMIQVSQICCVVIQSMLWATYRDSFVSWVTLLPPLAKSEELEFVFMAIFLYPLSTKMSDSSPSSKLTLLALQWLCTYILCAAKWW